MCAVDHARQRLRDVFWIGGGSGAGKSTIARRLAADHGFRLYDSDAAMSSHAARLSPVEAPLLERFIAMDQDQRWVHRSPEVMLETFHWFQGEGFDLIVQDLLELAGDGPVIAEGFRLLPRLVEPLVESPQRAIWLLPTPEFRASAFEHRRPAGMPWAFIDLTSDPDVALRNLLERDRMFTDGLSADAREAGLTRDRRRHRRNGGRTRRTRRCSVRALRRSASAPLQEEPPANGALVPWEVASRESSGFPQISPKAPRGTAISPDFPPVQMRTSGHTWTRRKEGGGGEVAGQPGLPW